MTPEQVAEAIDKHLGENARRITEPKEHAPGLWRALIIIGADGPLVSVEFGVSAKPEYQITRGIADADALALILSVLESLNSDGSREFVIKALPYCLHCGRRVEPGALPCQCENDE